MSSLAKLAEEARLDAKAFRENTVHDSEGDPIRLVANANRLDAYAAALATAEAEAAELRAEVERLREVARLAKIASEWHWYARLECGGYDDKDDLFQDLDFALTGGTPHE